MADEIRYTTHTDGSRSRARADDGAAWWVTVPSAAVLAATPGQRQRLSVAAQAPWPPLERAADGGPEVALCRVRTRREAEAAAASLAADGLRPQIRTAESGGSLASALGAASAAITLAAGSVLAWLLGVPFAGLGAVVGGALLVLAVVLGGRWQAARREQAARADAHQAVMSVTASAPEAWRALFALRAASLDADVPVQAQVDLWTALEGIERGLLGGTVAAGDALAQLEASRAALIEVAADPLAEARRSAELLRRSRAAIDGA